jgi:predicted RNA-binding protein YlxR (DUF448 family)
MHLAYHQKPPYTTSMPTPLRTCAATGQKLPQSQLLRFVNVNGVPTPEVMLGTTRAPGRGVYILPTAENLALAIRKKAFAHRLKTSQPPPPWGEIQSHLDTNPVKGHKAAEILKD